MDPLVKRRWVSALRSGNYRQGRRALMTHDNHHCPFGVLYKLMGFSFLPTIPGSTEWMVVGVGAIYIPDPTLLDLVGLTEDSVTEILCMNEEDGKSFADIADWIETNL